MTRDGDFFVQQKSIKDTGKEKDRKEEGSSLAGTNIITAITFFFLKYLLVVPPN